MTEDLIKQLVLSVKELSKINIPSEPNQPCYDWQGQTIDSLRWKYSVQYVSCISLARALFFEGDNVLYDNISEYSCQTGHAVQLHVDSKGIAVKIKTAREAIMFSHAYNFNKT